MRLSIEINADDDSLKDDSGNIDMEILGHIIYRVSLELEKVSPKVPTMEQPVLDDCENHVGHWSYTP